MATFTLTIDTDNAAFDGNLGEELFECLTRVRDKVASGEPDGNVRDTNGNTVGKFQLTDD